MCKYANFETIWIWLGGQLDISDEQQEASILSRLDWTPKDTSAALMTVTCPDPLQTGERLAVGWLVTKWQVERATATTGSADWLQSWIKGTTPHNASSTWVWPIRPALMSKLMFILKVLPLLVSEFSKAGYDNRCAVFQSTVSWSSLQWAHFHCCAHVLTLARAHLIIVNNRKPNVVHKLTTEVRWVPHMGNVIQCVWFVAIIHARACGWS